jgi:putative peptidoglycan lipid II flippase
MAAGTVVSRLIGFVRTAMLMAAIGFTGLHADIFNVANSVPNMVYILVAGGVFNAVLVPQVVRAIETDRDRGEAYVNRILTLFGLSLLIITIGLIIAAPWVMRLFVGGNYFTPALAAPTESLVDFARYCFPQIFFYGIFVLIGQVLNARHYFGPMMWAPVANNLVAIAVLGIYLGTLGGQSGDGAYSSSEEMLLGIGSTLGIVAQTAVLIPYLRKAGIRYRPRFDFRGTGLGHTLRLGLWTVLFVVVNQMAYIVVVRIASNASAKGALTGEPSTGYTAYSFSYLLLMVPHAIVTVSLVTAMLPRLSAMAAQDRTREFGFALGRTLRQLLGFILPVSAVLAVLGPFIALLAFSWGAAEGDRATMGDTLVAFSPALLLFTIHYLMLRGFYALEDTRTPFLIQCLVASTNAITAYLFAGSTSETNVAPSLALAYGAAYLVGAITSTVTLQRRLGTLDFGTTVQFTVKLIVASVFTVGVCWIVVWSVTQVGLPGESKIGALFTLLGAATLGVPTLFLAARILKLREISEVGSMLVRGLKRST